MNAQIKIVAEESFEGLAKLRLPFTGNHISKLPKETGAQAKQRKADQDAGKWPAKCDICGGSHHPRAVHLDYVGHAALTDRLLDTDPEWSWEPVAFRDGLPAFDQTGGLWIRLTVCGVTRLGYGHAAAKPNMDPGAREKEVIGDALRNAAMRFGAALDLWHKGDLHAGDDESEVKVQEPAPRHVSKGAEVPKTPTLAERKTKLEAAMRAQKSKPDLIKAYRLGSGLCADLDMKDPEGLAEIEQLYTQLLNAFDVPDLGIGDDEIPF